jgi:hypothetical protein
MSELIGMSAVSDSERLSPVKDHKPVIATSLLVEEGPTFLNTRSLVVT